MKPVVRKKRSHHREKLYSPEREKYLALANNRILWEQMNNGVQPSENSPKTTKTEISAVI